LTVYQIYASLLSMTLKTPDTNPKPQRIAQGRPSMWPDGERYFTSDITNRYQQQGSKEIQVPIIKSERYIFESKRAARRLGKPFADLRNLGATMADVFEEEPESGKTRRVATTTLPLRYDNGETSTSLFLSLTDGGEIFTRIGTFARDTLPIYGDTVDSEKAVEALQHLLEMEPLSPRLWLGHTAVVHFDFTQGTAVPITTPER